MAIDISLPRTIARPAAAPCIVVTDAGEAESLRLAWQQLQERSARNEITQSADWLLTWWRTFGGLQDRQLRLGLIYEGERLIGLAPLLRRMHKYRGGLTFRRLELLASGEPDSDEICSNHIGIVAERGAEEKVAHRLVAAIQAGVFGGWEEVVLPMMSGDTAMPHLLVEAFRAARIKAEAVVTAGAPYIPLPATWDEYLGTLSAKSRRNMQQSLKDLDHWAAGTAKLEWVADNSDLEKGKRIFIQLHQDRWAGDGAAGVFRSPRFVAFHDAMMRQLAERGALELLWLSVRGEPVAAFYGMVWDNKVSVYQLGRRTDVPCKVRVGSAMLGLVIRRAIEQGRREFDLLADGAFYKQQLTPHTRPLVQVRAARSCLVEVVRQFGTACLAGLRRLRRKND